MADADIVRALGRLEGQLGTVVTELAAVRQKQDAGDKEFAAMKNKGAGILIGVGLASGTVGAVGSTVLKGLFGGN